MAIPGFDILSSARQLDQVGFTREQAEAQVKIMTEAFKHGLETLVTREYLDVRLEALEERMNGKIRLLLWGQGLVVATVVLPALSNLFA